MRRSEDTLQNYANARIPLNVTRGGLRGVTMPAGAAQQSYEHFEGYHSVTAIYEGMETLVYRAKMDGSDAPVILKQTKNEYPSARESARLSREFVILRDLDLEHTPRALSMDARGRGVLLVMADIGHPTLREVLNKGKLDIESTLVLAISLSTVLAAVHRKRVIHKDITPRNVLVDLSTLEAYLIDFGISARLAREIKAPSVSRARCSTSRPSKQAE
jgi:serine/threonine protein kinase